MNRRNFFYLLDLVAIVIIVIGFRLAAQAGQGLGVVQNDGYAASGGILILLGGFLLGVSVASMSKKKDK